MVNLESTRGQIAQLEKKQKAFDKQLAEQQSLAERNAQERDAAEARARQAETKSLSLTHELEELQDKLEESDRLKKQLQVSGGDVLVGRTARDGGFLIGGGYDNGFHPEI